MAESANRVLLRTSSGPCKSMSGNVMVMGNRENLVLIRGNRLYKGHISDRLHILTY